MQPNIAQPNISNNIGTILRDDQGRLLPGQKLYKLRKHEGGGRKLGIKRQIHKVFEDLLPDCEAQIANLAFKSTNERVRLEACQYIRDCVRGKPHQSQDLRITAVSLFSGDDYEIAMRKVLEVDRRLIEQYSSQKEGSQDATEHTGSQGIHEEEKARFTE